MVQDADILFEAKDSPERLKHAHNIYLNVSKANKDNHEAGWKLARVTSYIGEFYPEHSWKGMYEEVLEFLQPKTISDTMTAEGYLWYGITIGRDGQEKGIMQSLKNLKLMKDMLLRSIEMDQSLEGGLAYRVLGRLYFTLPKIFGGNLDKSLAYLALSLEIAKNPVSYYYLAETHLTKGEPQKAKECLSQLNKLPDQGSLEIETRIYKEKALLMLNTLVQG